MVCEPEKDMFLFQTKIFASNQTGTFSGTITKRHILSHINSIYDPLGIVSLFTVRAKIMLRKLWGQDQQLCWDDPVPESIAREWLAFFQEVPQLNDVRFARCVKPTEAIGDPTLVIFLDGSGEAYGAVAYAHWRMSNGTYKARLLASKNRIAPIKVVDIVRPELCGAVIGTRIRQFILEEFRFKFECIIHIVDSEIVKAMIAKESYGFNTFAANRLVEIQKSTKPSEWSRTDGTNNIADWITRGKTPHELNYQSDWQSGPEFLKLAVQEWPVIYQSDIKELPELNRKTFVIASVEGTVEEDLLSTINIKRFSKLRLLINVTAHILMLYKKFHNRKKGTFELS